MSAAKFLQVLKVEDYRIESGVEAQPIAPGRASAADVIRVWLIGQPALAHHTVTGAFLEARASWAEPAVPRFDFHRRRILISYTLTSIQPVVSLLLGGVQLYCQYRELQGGSIYAGVHKTQHPAPNTAPEDLHWVPSG